MAYSKIATIYKTKNNFKKSLEYHKLYGTYKDSLAIDQNLKKSERYDFFKTTTEKNNAIKNLEIENKIQEIHVAKEQSNGLGLLIFTILIFLLLVIAINRNRLKQKAIKTIKEKNEENKLLIREIHHRVKNNLQIISSLLGVKINSTTNDKLKLILQESKNKIKSMALIHQKLYNDNQYEKVTLNTYINELITQIKSSFKCKSNSVFFDLDIKPREIQMLLAVPLGLMLNELITNCYKYAFSNQDNEDNKISIRFNQLKNTSKYALIVKDNGKGLSENFNKDRLRSFDSQLVHGLIEQLHGEVKINQDNGTTFTIVLEEPSKIIG